MKIVNQIRKELGGLKPLVTSLVLLATALVWSSGCAKLKKEPESSSSTGIADSLDTVQVKMEGASLIGNPEANPSSRQALQISDKGGSTLRSLQSAWETPGTINGLGWKQVSIKEQIGQAMDPKFTNPNGANITVFGRFKNAVRILCALDFMIKEKDENGMPKDGIYQAQLTLRAGSEVARRCGFEDVGEEREMSLTIAVQEPASTAVYSKQIIINMEGMENPFTFYLKMDSEAIRVATIEAQVSDSRNFASRTLVDYDRVKDVLRFEYLSQGFSADSGNELERIFIDGKAKKGYLLSHYGTSAASHFQQNFQFLASGSPVDAERQSVAVSVGYLGQQADNGAAISDLNACVNPVDGSIQVDDSLNCQLTGFPISRATGIQASFDAHATAGDLKADEATSIRFHNETDVHTAVSQ